MSTRHKIQKGKTGSLDTTTLILTFCFVGLVGARDIEFEHVVIDHHAIGHRDVGDIDGDGYNDIVVRTDSQLLWYKYPDWTKHVIIEKTEFRGDDMEIGDVDGDGDIDIIATISDAGRVYWYSNPRPAGNPAKDTWQKKYIGASEESKVDVKEATYYVAPGDETRYVKDIEVADFDRDGKLDVVTRTHGDVYIWLQQNPSSWKMVHLGTRYHEGMDVADLDRDGDADIVLNGYWLETPDEPVNDSWVVHNIDSKWWNQGPSKSWQDDNCKVCVGDMNRDGCLDILLSHSEKAGYPVSWYEAPVDPRDGVWTEHVIGYVDKCHNLKMADFDNDGDLDVLAGEMPNVRAEAPHPVLIFVNQADGLKWAKQVLTQHGNYSDQVGDIDNDGDIDVVGLRNHDRPPVEMWRNLTSDNKLSLDEWTYIQLDNKRDRVGDEGIEKLLRYFGLDAADITGDGYKDIIAGRYFYRNPAGNMACKWPRVDIGRKIDGMFFVDVDGDEFGDVIGTFLPDVYWLEPTGRQATSWNVTRIGTLKKTGHINGQGYRAAQIVPGGREEVMLTSGDGVYYFEVPDKPEAGNWSKTRIAADVSDEGIGLGDVDGDGLIDIVVGRDMGGEPRKLMFFRNPGDGSGDWVGTHLGTTEHAADRIEVADVSGDDRADIIVTEERPGRQPDASLYWFEQPGDKLTGKWTRHLVITEWSLNNLDVGDIDRDGDVDIVTCEHHGRKGTQKLQIFENDGKGNFSEHLIDKGKESHLGARLVDLDNDGDLDIISSTWNYYQFFHLWRNDALVGANE